MFTDISMQHRLYLFDKLITYIMNYAVSGFVFGFVKGNTIEKVEM